MKTIWLALLFSLNFCMLQAQSPLADSTPAKCKWNLTGTIYDTFYVQSRSYAKTNFPSNFQDVSYAGDSTNNCHPVSYCSGADSALVYDVYYPDYSYNNLKLPCVILLHAGGFSECTDLQLPEIKKICGHFARRGFIVFNVEYRRGSIGDDNKKYESVQQVLSQYRAYQDARGAIRSIIKRQRKHNIWSVDHYQIDTTKIFVGGMSAGAVAALNAAWYTDSMVYAIFPSPAGAPTIKDALGSINANFYYGDTTINYQQGIIGAISMWGGIRMPQSVAGNQSAFFVNAHRTPFIAFHGVKDKTIPYFINPAQDIYLSPPTHAGFYTESTCVINAYSVDGDRDAAKLIVGSGLNMYNIWNTLDTTMLKELYPDCQMKHGLDKDCPTCNFHSEFGTGLMSIDSVGIYMVQRAATLFQNIMAGKQPNEIGPPSIFTECENTRVRCAGPPDPQCNNTDGCQTD